MSCKRNEIVYFDSFGVEYVPAETKEFIWNKNIKTNIFGVQANNSVICGYFCIGLIDFMAVGKTLVDFTSLFSPCDFEKNDCIILSYFKDEWMQFHWNWQNKLDYQTKYKLNKITKIKNYFIEEVNQRKSCIKILNRYVTTFDYIDKILILLSAISYGVSIISFTGIVGAPVGVVSASFTLIFSLTTEIIKKITKYNNKQKGKAR